MTLLLCVIKINLLRICIFHFYKPSILSFVKDNLTYFSIDRGVAASECYIRDKNDLKWIVSSYKVRILCYYHLPLGIYLVIPYELVCKRRTECKCNENRSGVVTNTSSNILRHKFTSRTKEICDSWFTTFLPNFAN